MSINSAQIKRSGEGFIVQSGNAWIDLYCYGEEHYVNSWLSLSVEQFAEIKKCVEENSEVLAALREIFSFYKNGQPIHSLTSFVSVKSLEILLNAALLTEQEKLAFVGLLNPPPNEKPAKPKSLGWVYLMLDKTSSKTKIGYSNNPQYRESTLQSEKPSISLIEAWQGTRDDEKRLHALIADKRVRGEWFDLSDVDFSSIYLLMGNREVYTGK